MRKTLLLLLLCIGFHGFVNAQSEDSVYIYLPWGSDTTCPGTQLTFTAVETNDTMTGTIFRWYANDAYTGISIDTFITTALNNGDSVYCKIFFTNSLGFADSFQSNTLTIYRSTAVVPTVLASLTAGSNPDCPGHPLTFTAYPGNGGPGPLYQWRVDGIDVPGATSNTYTNIFNDNDTVTVMMVSNSTCAAPTDTAYSNWIEVIHDSLTATLAMSVMYNPICVGTPDTFTAVAANEGMGASIYWFVNGIQVPGAIGPMYATDTLHNGDIVYAMLIAPDDCVINDTTISTAVTMTVLPNVNPMVSVSMTNGANPGCIDSAVTFTATWSDGGVAPDLLWLINDTVNASGTASFTHTYRNGDLLSFRLRTTDGGCYVNDSVTTAAVLMVRDSTPVAPLISLIDDELVANTAGTYIWYFNGVVIPGANGQIYHPAGIGYYTARRDTGNCPSEFSNVIFVSLLKVSDVNGSRVNIYPNPTKGMITLDWGQTVTAQITVTNMIGQVMLTEMVNGSSRHNTDMSRLPAGNYAVTVRDEYGNASVHKVQLTQ